MGLENGVEGKGSRFDYFMKSRQLAKAGNGSEIAFLTDYRTSTPEI